MSSLDRPQNNPTQVLHVLKCLFHPLKLRENSKVVSPQTPLQLQ